MSLKFMLKVKHQEILILQLNLNVEISVAMLKSVAFCIKLGVKILLLVVHV